MNIAPAAIKPVGERILPNRKTVNDFEWQNKIGQGTYGIVYKGRDLETGKDVALKKIRLEK